jgi:hypothetical protein
VVVNTIKQTGATICKLELLKAGSERRCMQNSVHQDYSPQYHQQTQQGNQASQTKERVLKAVAGLSKLEQNRVTQELFVTEGWKLWQLGGFCFDDGSVLLGSGLGWQTLSAAEASKLLENELRQELRLHLHYSFYGSDRREKRTITEARFEYQEQTKTWKLMIQYEAFMDSPIYGLTTIGFKKLTSLNLWNLWVDTAKPNHRWRLEHIAGHPDWQMLGRNF